MNKTCFNSLVLLLGVFVVITGACAFGKAGDRSGKLASNYIEPKSSSPGSGRTDAELPEWKQKLSSLEDSAKREARISVVGSVSANVRSILVSEFKSKYGINMEFISGRPQELVNKLFSERKAGLYLTDIYIGGTSTFINLLKPEGVLEKMDSSLILPELTDPAEIKKVWWRGELLWVDPGHTVLSFLSALPPPVVINTSIVKLDEIKSYRDLLAPKWKGKISFSDPTVPGFGQMWFAAGAVSFLSLDYMRELARQEPLITRDLRLQVEWLAQGKYPVALCPQSDVVAEFMQVGAPMGMVTPVEGVHISSGLGNFSLIKNAPHPNASRLFINWMLSKEGQTIYSEALLYPSARLDVPKDKVTLLKFPQQEGKYLIVDEEKFLVEVRPKMDEFAKELFGPLTK